MAAPVMTQFRTWVLPLPARVTGPRTRQWLNANDRGTYKARMELTAALRKDARDVALGSGIPRIPRARITAVYEPPDYRHHDPGNLYPTAKAYVDGLRDAGVLDDDSVEYVVGPFVVPGYPYDGHDPRLKMARMVLRVTELPPIARIPCKSAKAAAAVAAEARHGFGDPDAPGEYRVRPDGKTAVVMYTDWTHLATLAAWAFQAGYATDLTPDLTARP